MPTTERAPTNKRANAIIKFAQANLVGHARPSQANLFGDLRMGETEALLELAKGIPTLYGVEIFPLHVLDDRPLGRCLIVDLPNNCRYTSKPSNRRSSPSSLTGHQFMHPIRTSWSHNDRLHDASCAN